MTGSLGTVSPDMFLGLIITSAPNFFEIEAILLPSVDTKILSIKFEISAYLIEI